MAEIKTAKAPTANVARKAPASTKDYVNMMMPEIKKALPSVMTPERFTRVTLSALSNTPKLQQCTPKSFLGAMMTSAQLGLEPNTPLGQAYLIPYNNHGTLECQMQIGYKGMIDLAHRAGTSVTAEVIYENDDFEYELGMNPVLKHKPALKDRGKPVAYYATWKNPAMAAEGFSVMSVEDIQNHAKKYSKAYGGSSPWTTNFDAMAKKTVIKQALKYAPMSTEFQHAMAADETIKTTISKDMTEVEDSTVYESIVNTDTGEVIDAEVVSNE